MIVVFSKVHNIAWLLQVIRIFRNGRICRNYAALPGKKMPPGTASRKEFGIAVLPEG